ncbi:6-hydroxynicotinate 3-monooxygenase precursor [Pigmentiphaga humi]|uniref:6-hydroxynicotinate 3-monooxygenase n=1 Tax=Pigmentiphaga humi TaxID=2478468 RepID=A0A3P4B3K4_9BURK|nr:FAD-dependent monooxygenase [Pigmentiphaga humi]VCU70869.1 6-hydroxynicotinate 3-monooxygenase precursor [Pigmentiphaga humi]
MEAQQRSKPRIAIIGAGIGGLAAAATLRQVGCDVRIYEQASRFARVGAGIQMAPNACKVLRRLGVEDRLKAVALVPESSLNRDFDTGAISNEYPIAGAVEERYGASFLCLHRGDLHAALESLVPHDIVELERHLVDVEQDGQGVALKFADGSTARADAVIGADGVHSQVRECLFGEEQPTFTGRIAYRATFPAHLLQGQPLERSRIKWWGPDRHIVMYYTTSAADEIYFTTSVPDDGKWATTESWSTKGDLGELRAAFASFHPQVRAVLDACPDVFKWALLARDPMPAWTRGRVTLLGDACHPMPPYMAQGASAALEDAAVLARCLEGVPAEGIPAALLCYEATRRPRTSQLQTAAKANNWMRHDTDPGWVYGYDAWSVPLAAAG